MCSEAAAVCEMPSKGKCETTDGARVGSNMDSLVGETGNANEQRSEYNNIYL